MRISSIEGKRALFETGIGMFFEPRLRSRYGIFEDKHVLLHSLRLAEQNNGLGRAISVGVYRPWGDSPIVLLTALSSALRSLPTFSARRSWPAARTWLCSEAFPKRAGFQPK